MPRYLIERTFTVSIEEMPPVAARSKRIVTTEFPDITWEHSHVVVTDDGRVRTFCVYSAPDEEMVREHSKELGAHIIDVIHEIVHHEVFPIAGSGGVRVEACPELVVRIGHDDDELRDGRRADETVERNAEIEPLVRTVHPLLRERRGAVQQIDDGVPPRRFTLVRGRQIHERASNCAVAHDVLHEPWRRHRVGHDGALGRKRSSHGNHAQNNGNGQYEKPVLPEPDPNAWVHLKVVVRGNDVSAFVNGTGSPALHVQGLSGRSRGGVGLWVGDPSPGDFANLVVRPGK